MASPTVGSGVPETDADRRVLRALAVSGYGHFTTMLVTDRRVPGLELHLDRLAHDCRTLFGTGLDLAGLRERIRDAVPERGRVVARVTVADPAIGPGTMGAQAHPEAVIGVRPAPPPAAPLRVRTVVHRRYLPRVKSVGLFPALHLRRLALHAGVDDVVFTTEDGALLEGSTWNLGLIAGDRVVWPDGPVLEGTTRTLLRTALRAAGVDESAARVDVAELHRFDAAFTTNVSGIRAISVLDEQRLDVRHPLLDRLDRLHDALAATPL